MGKLLLTQEIIYAAGRDAADRAARKAGRTYWTAGDYATAVAEMHRLIARVTPETLQAWGWA